MIKSLVYTLGILLAVVILYTVIFSRAGRWLVKDDAPMHGDAMVLLMGGISNRVLQAADLYSEGRAGRIIIVEESMGSYRRLEERGAKIISNTQQVRNAAVALGIPADSITVLPGDARSTLHEVFIVRDYLYDTAGTDTIIFVTDPPHTRRVSMIARHVLKDSGRQITVFCSPSTYSGFEAEGWWRDKEGIQAVMTEYIKIAGFVMFERKKSGVHRGA